MTSESYSPSELVEEFEWTRSRHGGLIVRAAPIFGLTPGALEKRLRGAKQQGLRVEYLTDGMKNFKSGPKA